ncbi:archaetidylserine decarboxylase [Psittacicella hinzii]
MNLKIFIHKYLTPRHLLTKLVGKLASAKLGKVTTLAIKAFVKLNKVNLAEAKRPKAEDYSTFNEFFIRELPEDARPIGQAEFVSPADGKIAMIGQVNNGAMIQAKGHNFAVRELLGISSEEAEQYNGCTYVTVYLSPRDYHRVHMPCKATLKKSIFIPGDLYSVNENAFKNISNLYARNERLVCYFDTEYGPMIQVLVGATITGSIKTYWDNAIDAHHAVHFIEKRYADNEVVLEKGQLMGAFLMGSTTINIFPKQLQLTDNVVIGEKIKVNEDLGNIAV